MDTILMRCILISRNFIYLLLDVTDLWSFFFLKNEERSFNKQLVRVVKFVWLALSIIATIAV